MSWMMFPCHTILCPMVLTPTLNLPSIQKKMKDKRWWRGGKSRMPRKLQLEQHKLEHKQQCSCSCRGVGPRRGRNRCIQTNGNAKTVTLSTTCLQRRNALLAKKKTLLVIPTPVPRQMPSPVLPSNLRRRLKARLLCKHRLQLLQGKLPSLR